MPSTDPALPSPWEHEQLRPLPGPVWPTFPLLALITQMAHTGSGEGADSNWGLGGQASNLQTTRGARLLSTGTEPLAPCGALHGQSGNTQSGPKPPPGAILLFPDVPTNKAVGWTLTLMLS